MVKFLQHRIGDRRILRLIRTWLRAGVLEDGQWSETEKGTPQGVPDNLASLKNFRLEVSKRWLRVLFRRSQKSRMTWERLAGFVEQWLPLPKILHPYPNLRFDAKHPRPKYKLLDAFHSATCSSGIPCK